MELIVQLTVTWPLISVNDIVLNYTVEVHFQSTIHVLIGCIPYKQYAADLNLHIEPVGEN